MTSSKFKYQRIMILLLPFGLILNKISQLSPAATESIYSMGLYNLFAPLLSKITGLFSFSIAELVIIALVAIVIWQFIVFCIDLYQKKDKLDLLKNVFLNILAVAGAIYFLFLTMWGFNYNRLSIATIMELDIKPVGLSTLESMCTDLISQSNTLREKLPEDKNKTLAMKNGYEGALSRSHKAYNIFGGVYSQFGKEYGTPKPIILSTPMSYTHIWGVYTFFTAEANVNSNIPLAFYPSTVIHEMAHQYGFAREDEANFISYLVCNTHPDIDFQYSGNLLALTYSLSQLNQNNNPAYKRLKKEISPEVLRDLNTPEVFNKKYAGPVSEFSSKTNDLYLKANNQKEGERSYGKMVDLLLAQYKKTH